jgi:hypothetical protein
VQRWNEPEADRNPRERQTMRVRHQTNHAAELFRSVLPAMACGQRRLDTVSGFFGSQSTGRRRLGSGRPALVPSSLGSCAVPVAPEWCCAGMCGSQSNRYAAVCKELIAHHPATAPTVGPNWLPTAQFSLLKALTQRGFELAPSYVVPLTLIA